MHVRRVLVLVSAVAMVVTLPVLGMWGTASARAKPHIIVTASPNPLIETGISEIHAVIQVEARVAYAGMTVEIESHQLNFACAATYFSQNSGLTPSVSFGLNTPALVTLDNDGNATVELDAYNCAPNKYLIEADLVAAPYYTAVTELRVKPPHTTAHGLTGYPNPEVETGDGTVTGSNVYAVFYAEMPTVYADAPVAISSSELQDRCKSGFQWEAGNTGYPPVVSTTGGVTTTLDNDGNAVFIFQGIACTPGKSTVTADLVSGGSPEKVVYVIHPNTPTI
jgi:hypothetical protein